MRVHPPAAPCLAEYGDQFPAFVARHLGRTDAPYVQSFGELEWLLGAVSIAVDVPAVAPDSVPRDGDALASATAVLQPGLRYLRTEWPVHDLLKRFLTDTAPDVYDLRPTTVRDRDGQPELAEGVEAGRREVALYSRWEMRLARCEASRRRPRNFLDSLQREG